MKPAYKGRRRMQAGAASLSAVLVIGLGST
jgi:hypothetical protein